MLRTSKAWLKIDVLIKYKKVYATLCSLAHSLESGIVQNSRECLRQI